MSTYIAFLRAVNVGGRTVKMAALRGYLEDAGFLDVETYIQSGNVRVGSKARSTSRVEELLEKTFAKTVGFEVPALVRTPKQLSEIVDQAPANPLADEARHYLTFLRSQPTRAVTEKLDGWDVDGERLKVVGRELHMWFTKPSHEAVATNAKLEKLTGIVGTGRNWKVVTALATKWGDTA